MSDEDSCPRGERGPRGHRGPDGEPGPPGGGGLLKFSGFPLVADGPTISYLADNGASAGPTIMAPSYPDAIPRDLRNLAVNVSGIIVPTNAAILVELIDQTLNAVPGFAIAYGAGETGVKTVVAGPAPFSIGDRFNLRITTSGLGEVAEGFPIISATVGVE